MKFDKYQLMTAKTDQFQATSDPLDPGFTAKLLGLAGETGEVEEKFKKIIRDKGGKISEEDKLEIAKELGDVLWYIASIARYIDVPLEDIAQMNLDKLESRKARGVIAGSGDNR